PSVQTVARHAPDRQEQDVRERGGDPDDRERRWGVRELVHLPGEGDQERAVPEQRHGHPRPEESEVAQVEGPEHADARSTPHGAPPVSRRAAPTMPAPPQDGYGTAPRARSG